MAADGACIPADRERGSRNPMSTALWEGDAAARVLLQVAKHLDLGPLLRMRLLNRAHRDVRGGDCAR